MNQNLEANELAKSVPLQRDLSEAVLGCLGAGLLALDASQPNGRIVFVSDGFGVITRYRPTEAIGQKLSLLYGSKTDAVMVKAAKLALAKGKAFQGELLCYRADGTTVWCELVLAPMKRRNESPGQFAGALIDISARKERESKLLEAEAKARGIFDNSIEGIYQSTPEGRYLAVNRGLARMYGYEHPSELMNQVSDIEQQIYVDPGMRERFKTEIERSDVVRGLEYQVRRRDGRIIWISESARVVRDLNGRVRYYEGFVEEITERKEAEAALQISQQRLVETSLQVGMAEMATGILHNLGNALNSINVSASIVSEKVRKSSVGNVSKVASLMNAHASELCDFLTNDPKGKQIPMYLEQLGEHLVAEQTGLRDELSAMRKSVEHAKGIVAIQQSYAKTSNQSEAVGTRELVEDALAMTASSLARHNVQVIRDYALVLPEVTVPKHAVLQILINLIRNAQNAFDAIELVDKRLTVAARASQNGQWVRLEVKDNAVGMSSVTLARLFNHGFTTRKDGHGFGLHSGAMIAKEMGGSLTGHSEGLGKGATFVLEFPCKPPVQKGNPTP